MAKTIQEIIKTEFPNLPASVTADLERCDHIELTQDETDEALLLAKVKKARRLEKERREAIEAENRRHLMGYQWAYKQTESFMIWRANEIFAGSFRIDDTNKLLFELLCFYFSNDPEFDKRAKMLGVVNPSLAKGILLAGDYGVGKTTMMKLFQRNQRQTYYMRNAKQIADAYQADGIEASLQYEKKFANASNDKNVFLQKHSGLCIDDMGTEAVKKNFGNQRNVIGDLIELRYASQTAGVWLHGTTNLNAEELGEYYGPRVRSRMREIFNVIQFKGADRRK